MKLLVIDTNVALDLCVFADRGTEPLRLARLGGHDRALEYSLARCAERP
jgi:hypothetical protein